MELSPALEAALKASGGVPAKAFKSLVKGAAAVLLEQADEAAVLGERAGEERERERNV